MKKAVIIGITYVDVEDDPMKVLTASAIDVRKMREFLTKRGYELRILTDDRNDSSPNKSYPDDINIRKALEWLVQGASPGDKLFLHYSGHGQQISTDSATESDGMDEAMIPAIGESIRDNDLRAILVDKLPPDCQLVAVFDCCHSGTLLDLHHRAKAEYSPKSNKLEIAKESKKDLNRVWRFGGAAVYSARLNPPKSPFSEDRSPTYPLPNQFQIPIIDPCLLWENRKLNCRRKKINRSKERRGSILRVNSPVPMIIVAVQDGPGIGLGIQHTIPLSLLGCPTPPRTLTKNPVKKWVNQLQRVMRPRIITEAPLTESPNQSRRSTFIQSRFSCSSSSSAQTRRRSILLPTSPVTTTQSEDNTNQATKSSIPLQLPSPAQFNSDLGYTVERRNTFAAFHSPSNVKRVITYSACTDAQNIYDDDEYGGLLTSHFIQFMDRKRPTPITLSKMLIELTKTFAEINEHHLSAKKGQPPMAMLCTADRVNLDDQLTI